MSAPIVCGVAMIFALSASACQDADADEMSREAPAVERLKTQNASLRARVDTLVDQNLTLQEQVDTLAAQNAELAAAKAEREAATTAAEMEANRRFSADAPAGIWQVRMKCVESDCPARSPGDVITETWNISYTGKSYRIDVTNGAPNTNRLYVDGSFDGKVLRVGFFHETRDWGSSSRAKVGVAMRMKENDLMTGVRKVLNNDPCLISYQITATRSR